MSELKKKSFKSKHQDRMRDKEYTKTYLNQKRKRQEEPNNYPMTRLILIRDFLRAPDLYKAIAFFFSVQIVIATIAAGVAYPKMAGAMNLLALAIGAISIFFSTREINRRQRLDPTRRSFKVSRVIKIIIVMLISLFAMTLLVNVLGIEPKVQPNQTSLDDLMKLFPFAMIFTLIIVSPITEEVVFRELIPFAIGPSYLAFITSSILFIALHAPAGIIGWSSYAILACGFLYARLKDNNVYTGIAVHITWNAIAILM